MFRSRWAIATALVVLVLLAPGDGDFSASVPGSMAEATAADTFVDPAIISLKANVTKLSATKVEIEIVGTIKNNGGKTFKSGPGQQAVRLYAYPSLSFGGAKGKVLLEREFTTLKAGQHISYRYTMTWDVTPGVGRIPHDYVFQIDYDPDIRMDGNPNNDDANLTNNKKSLRHSDINKKVLDALGK